MPTYIYGLQHGAPEPGCDICRTPFEVVQRMSDSPLTACPKCSAPIERRIQAPLVSNSENLKGPSASKLAQAGFTQYKRQGKGYYEKSFGKGPGSLHP